MEKSLIDMTQDEWRTNYSLAFGLALLAAHNRAVAKHPMTGMRNQDDCYKVDSLAEAQKLENDYLEKNSEYSWLTLLKEEIYEAVAEINKGNWGKAQTELVQVAQVAFRGWLWCEERKSKAKKGAR